MRNFIFGLLLMTMTSLANATSLHPCTPTVKLMPMQIHCKTENIYTSILIQTWVSPQTPICQGKNQFKNSWAEVTFSTEGKTLVTLNIKDSDFQFKLSSGSDGYFKSKRHSIDLDNCSSPLHGGFSLGN